MLVAIITFGVRTARNVKIGINDPAERAAQAEAILGYRELPEGYQPAVGISVPFVLRLAVLADTAPGADGKFHEAPERAFFYVRPARWMAHKGDLREVFEGAGNPSRAFERWQNTNIRIRGNEQISEGSVTVNGREIPYAARRGELEVDNDEVEGILAVFVVQCGEGREPGLGGWLVPDTDDLTGTSADPAALADFLSAFELCR